jgi:O-antigen/teichoic acid export membrane protein
MKETMFKFSKRVLQHELIRGSSFLFIGYFFANILAFLFNLLVVRKLTPNNYGEYASLMSLFGLAVMPAGSLTTIIVKFATDFFSQNELSKAKKLYKQISYFLLFLCGVILLAVIFGSGIIQNFLHIHNTFYVVLVGVLISISYITIVNNAFLQSILRFDLLAIMALVAAIVKLVAGFAFISLNFALTGVFVALLFSSFIQYILPFFPLRFLFTQNAAKQSVPIRNLIVYAMPASLTVFALSSLTSTDVILVKHFLDPLHAGFYAGLSLVGKVIFYFTVPISSVMFPLLIKRFNKGENVLSLLLLSLLLVLIPGLIISTGYFLFPNLVIQFFLGGQKYESVAGYVGYFGIFLTIFSVINILVNFFLSLNKTGIAYIVTVAAMVQIFLISLFHKDFTQLITVSIGVSLVLVMLLLLYYGKVYGQLKKQKKGLLVPNYPSV